MTQLEVMIATRTAKMADKSLIISLMRSFSGELGFVPSAAIEWYIEAGQVKIVLENGEAAGYVLGRQKMRYESRIVPITQAAVRMDAQRRSGGLRLVARVISDAISRNQECAQAWCADDIEAKHFWCAAGFRAVCRRAPENSRGRTLTLWRRPIGVHKWQPWMSIPPAHAGYRASRVVRPIQLIDDLGRQLDVNG